ncbi:hypothetical protein ACMYSQ_001799 [Aspergillus niger]
MKEDVGAIKTNYCRVGFPFGILLSPPSSALSLSLSLLKTDGDLLDPIPPSNHIRTGPPQPLSTDHVELNVGKVETVFNCQSFCLDRVDQSRDWKWVLPPF